MKTSNNSPADNEVAENDTPNALISDNDLLKFFNLERENVQNFSITHRKDGMYVNITLNKTWVQCPVCGHMTSRVKWVQYKFSASQIEKISKKKN